MKSPPTPDSIPSSPMDDDASDALKARIDRLEHEKARYLRMFVQSGAPAISVEADMGISLANAKFEELVGYSREAIEGRIKWPDFMALSP